MVVWWCRSASDDEKVQLQPRTPPEHPAWVAKSGRDDGSLASASARLSSLTQATSLQCPERGGSSGATEDGGGTPCWWSTESVCVPPS